MGTYSTTLSDTAPAGAGKCGLRRCPSSRDKTFTCDVYGDVGPGRINTLMQEWSKEHKDLVDATRQANGRPAIDYSKTDFVARPAHTPSRPKMKTNLHEVPATPPPTSEPEVEEEADLDDVLAAMATRWHTEGITEE